ncbi:terpene synthase family protein [Chitinophaga cymbidii]|uniref:Terpene synthase n=1 Tax=Chitinophaga cymbidii TaxID=1096750 RepID=A0A512RNB7_9BACT|nr:hypothetical protein [Chitinophaga cymbidii]GEP97195.1 hypothetical protein CCY01nite_34550 [Chitinophaga cymbidii]
MYSIILPKRLYCPFPSRINSHVLAADAHTVQWIRKFGLLHTEQQIQQYRKEGYAYMVARMFPNADRETLCAYSDLNTLLFLVDDFLDQQDAMVSGGHDSASVEQFSRHFVAILENPSIAHHSKEPVFAALADLWERLIRLGTPEWLEKYKKSLWRIFHAALWQHKNIEAGRWPSVEDYMARRQYIGAANVATDCVEMIDRITLPADAWEHPVLTELTELCRNTVCWANDLFSLSKEREKGEYHNLVTILAHEKNTSLNKAISRTIAIHDHQVRRFIRLTATLPSFNEAVDMEIVRYVEGLKAIMRANIDWSNHETSRYHFQYADLAPVPANAPYTV